MLTKEKSGIQEWVERIPFEEINKHPNILIAARLWDDERFEAAAVCYKFMRHLDDMIDDRKATGKIISCMEKKQFTQYIEEWISCLGGKTSANPLLRRVSQTVIDFKIPVSLFYNFSKSMLYDVNHSGFDTFEDFLRYSEGASVAPASVFVHLCGLKASDFGYLPPMFDVIEVARPCAIFSYLVHIIRDFQKDQRENLNYFSNDILAQNNLQASDLKTIAQTEVVPENFRNVIRFYMNEAEKYRLQTEAMIQKVSHLVDQRYLLSLNVIYQLYLLVYHKIDVDKGNFTEKELNPSTEELKAHLLRILN